MDENQNFSEENKIIKEEKMLCKKHPMLKCLFCGLMVFLGAFCAFYVVADWHFKTMFRMRHQPPYERQMEKLAKKEMKNFETVINREGKKLQKNGNIIHLQNTGKEYRIIIDLRAFDNNENNVHISTSGNILTIVGRTVRKSKNDEQISEFQQNYLFGSNVKLSDLTKETYGNYYVINIPIKKSEIEEE